MLRRRRRARDPRAAANLRTLAHDLRGYAGWRGDTPIVVADAMNEQGFPRLAREITAQAYAVRRFEGGSPRAKPPSGRKIVALHKSILEAIAQVERGEKDREPAFVWWTELTPSGYRTMPVAIVGPLSAPLGFGDRRVNVRGLIGRWRETFPVLEEQLTKDPPVRVYGKPVSLYRGAQRYTHPL